MDEPIKKKKLDDDTANRKWLLTINNPQEHECTHDDIKNILGKIKGRLYWCMCDEIGGKTNCYHTHLFIYRPSSFKFMQIKKMFPSAHIDYVFGTNQDCRNYIRKEGKYKNSEKKFTNLIDTFEESGECPEDVQGKRNDLHNLYQMIKDDFSIYDILEADAVYIDKLDKIEQVREVLRYEEFKNKRRLDMQVEYWYGEAGVGKSRAVRDMYGDCNVYCVSSSRNPWDGYKGQDVILFDDFRSSMFDITDLLRWLDVYPLELPCRYRNKQACFTKVYFTSNVAFDSLYKYIQDEDKETWKAFCRRFHCIKKFEKGKDKPHITEYTSIDDYLERFESIPSDVQLKLDELFGT